MFAHIHLGRKLPEKVIGRFMVWESFSEYQALGAGTWRMVGTLCRHGCVSRATEKMGADGGRAQGRRSQAIETSVTFHGDSPH
jgi:hypothetical protein